jgi:hypothetical protein
MAFVSTFDHTNPMADKNPNLEMLMQREQLMEDIECIVEERILSQFGSEFGDVSDDIIRVLCDAVCKNFPTK